MSRPTRLERARQFGTLLGLVALSGVLWALTPHFLTVPNLLNIAQQTSLNAIVAVGMTYVIVSGGPDHANAKVASTPRPSHGLSVSSTPAAVATPLPP